ncbi:AraC family transcriptional regulator [Anaerotaenia torta]|uniref:GyrI-like domain-containing protein n=1 Tax=Anaerotaenia torta TaxID=433293 RepID=UPI003D22C4E8
MTGSNFYAYDHGVNEMHYMVFEKRAFNVLGIRRITPQSGGTWGIVKAEGAAKRLQEISRNPCNLGLCFGFDKDGNNDYMCGVEYKGEAVTGFDLYRCPASTWLIFTAKGRISEDIIGKTWKRIHGEFMLQSEYQQQQDMPAIERYSEWDETADTCQVEIFIPVKKES